MSYAQKGLELLSQAQIQKALWYFTQGLNQNPQDNECYLGALLCDFAVSNQSKALGLLEFYHALCFEDTKANAQKKLLAILQELDEEETQENKQINQSFLSNTESLPCITFEDFRNFILTKSNFKEAFEDFSLSTKIMFNDKNELCDFLNLLIDNGYANLSLEYAENIQENMGFDIQLNQILERATKISK